MGEWVLRERFATEAGDIAWDRLGDGPPVVMMHGTPWSSWTDVVALAPWGSPFYRLVRDHDTVFEQLPAAIHEGVLRAYVGTAQPRPLDRDVEDALIAPWLGRAGQSAFYRQIAQGDQRHTDDIEPLFDQITAPTLVIWGEADPWIPAAHGAELARRIPAARLALLPTAGHLVQQDQPDELTRLLGEHLDAAFA